jgi:hypothetical protein
MATAVLFVDVFDRFSIADSSWLLLSVGLMEGYSVWCFARQQLFHRGARVFSRLYSYVWLCKVGLKIAVSVVFVVCGFANKASSIVAVVAAAYFTVNLLVAIFIFAADSRCNSTKVADIYQVFYKTWRVVLAVQLVVLEFNLKSATAPYLGWALLPTLIFSLINFVALTLVIIFHAIKIRKNRHLKPRVSPLKINSEKSGCNIQSSVDDSREAFHAEISRSPNHHKPKDKEVSSLANGSYLYLFWALSFILLVALDFSMQRNPVLINDRVWVRTVAAIAASGLIIFSIIGFVVKRNVMYSSLN